MKKILILWAATNLFSMSVHADETTIYKSLFICNQQLEITELFINEHEAKIRALFPIAFLGNSPQIILYTSWKN